ncbi:MAG: VWA domain-containing protein [Acidobacteria bacterium]|nr:VWA domain-containing protein [Acidobacteriota bacterium]
MSRAWGAVLCLAVSGVVLTAARQQYTFQGAANSVPVYTTVVDAGGRLVTDLVESDFEVFDNGAPQALTLFANEIQPITIVVMLDRSQSMERNNDLVRDAAGQFIGHLDDTDRAKVGSFSNHIQIDPQEFTSDRAVLAGILRDRLVGPGMTPLWNATARAMDALSGETRRKVVLVFTDGFNTPQWGEGNVSFSTVQRRAQVEGVMIYAVGLADVCGDSLMGMPGVPRFEEQRPGGRLPPMGPGRRPGGPIGRGPLGRPPVPFPPPIGRPPGDGFPGLPGDPRDDEVRRPRCVATKPDPGLREIADMSGGGYFELSSTDNLAATFTRVADELHRQYLLAYQPPAFDGTLHTIDVRVRKPGVIARARRSYLAPLAATSAREAVQPR